MNKYDKETREYIEAVPGPAIIISKETYEKMKKDNSCKQNKERLEKYAEFFKRIKKTKKSNDDELTL